MMNGRQSAAERMSAHESGNTIMKKIAKVAVGKSMAPECAAARGGAGYSGGGRRAGGRSADGRSSSVSSPFVANHERSSATATRRRNVRPVHERVPLALRA